MPVASLLSYDQVPYHSGPFRQTHPSHLAALPILFGLKPPPVRGGRVLELGCASGSNIIPMAQDLPESQFVGIDLSARQIAEGRGMVAELGLDNIQLRHQSILEVDEGIGQFDFIICHGVYSWVPRPVQDKILQIGSRNLRPGGLCYVSYNTLPGWHLRGVVRDMMRYHVATLDDPQTKIDQARCLLDFLNSSSTPRSEAYRRLLADEAEILGRLSDSYLFHEHLEEVNEPLYFYQFVERAQSAGLAYLAETDFSTMLARNFDPDTAAILAGAPLLRQEQYMDFLRNRMFRGSVLCHAAVKIDRSVPALRLARCHVSLDQKLPLEEPRLGSSEPMEVGVGPETITASQAITKAALVVLNVVWPDSLTFDELSSAAAVRAQESGASRESLDVDRQRAILATDLMTLFTRGMLRLLVDPPRIVLKPGPRPQATPLARMQARRGDLVTNRRHEMLRLSDLSRALLVHLDGRHDRAALIDWLGGAITRGDFRVHRDDEPLSHVDSATLAKVLDATLKSLAQGALLMA